MITILKKKEIETMKKGKTGVRNKYTINTI